ncbi:hypothetical protein B1L11_29470 [Microbispora sp. GKU 823]|nr:hypothetical protein B1L11_29470 [Microbispora sp. GKU 823]
MLGDVVCLTRGSRPQADPLRRLRAMLEVSDLLGRHAPQLRTAYDLRLAEGPDLEAVLEAVRDRVPDGLAEALGRLDPNAVERLPVLRRLQIHFAAHGMTGELAELRTFAASEIRHRGVLRRGLRRRRWYLDYPFRRDPRLPRSLFDATRDLRLVACVDDVRHADGRLALTGHAYIAHLDSGRSRIELWLQRGEERIILPVHRTRRPDVTADSRQSVACHDDSGFETVIALDALPAGRWALHTRVRARGVTRAGRAIGAPGDRVFDAGNVRVSLTHDRGLTLGPRAAGGPSPDPDDRVDTARRTESEGQVSAARWTESGELVLEGTGPCPAGRIVLERGAERHSWPVRQDEATWTAAIGRTAEGLPLRSGTWRVLALSPTGGDERVRLSPALIADPPRPRVTGFHEISVRTSRDGDLSLAVRPALGPHERGPYATRRRRASAPRRVTLRNAAVFDSYGGGQYSCNPRAVSEELARRHPDVEIVWVTRDGQFAVPPGVRLVLYGSREHEEALRTSRFVVANRRTQPGWYRKPRGQTVVQTWHGTPLKRLGLDLEGMPYAQRVPRDELARQVATWDLLLSPSPFATSALRGAFGYEGEILESGYPRNDVLFDPGRAARPGGGWACRTTGGSSSTRRRGGTTRPPGGSRWTRSGRPGRCATTTCCSCGRTTWWRGTWPSRTATASAMSPDFQTWRICWPPRTCWSPTTRRRCSTSRAPAGPWCSSRTTWSATATRCAASTSTSRPRPPDPSSGPATTCSTCCGTATSGRSRRATSGSPADTAPGTTGTPRRAWSRACGHDPRLPACRRSPAPPRRRNAVAAHRGRGSLGVPCRATGRAARLDRPAVVTVVPAVLALAAGLWDLGGPPPWRDEAATVSAAVRTLPQLAHLLQSVDAVHGLYYALMHVVAGLSGTAEVALRIPSVVAGALAAAGTGALGRALGAPRAGLYGGVLLALMPIFSRYVQEARPYALTAAAAVGVTLLFLRVLRSPTSGVLAAYAAALTVLAYLNLFAFLVVGAHGVALILSRGPLLRWACAATPALAAVAPLAWLGSRQSAQVGWIPGRTRGMWAGWPSSCSATSAGRRDPGWPR